MTTDSIKELVKRLRDAGLAYGMGTLPLSAADALETMAGEVERLTVAAKAADMFHAINGHGIKQAEELADHIIRQMLWGMRIDDSNKGIVRGYLLDHFKAVISRAEAAEAERDKWQGKSNEQEDRADLLTAERDRLKAVLKPRLNAKAIEGLQEILEAMEAMDEREAPFLKTLLDWHEASRKALGDAS